MQSQNMYNVKNISKFRFRCFFTLSAFFIIGGFNAFANEGIPQERLNHEEMIKEFKVTPETPNANKIIEEKNAEKIEKTVAPERKNKNAAEVVKEKVSKVPATESKPQTKNKPELPGLLNDPTSPIYLVLIVVVLAIVFMKFRQAPQGKE